MIFWATQSTRSSPFGSHRAIENARRAATQLSQKRVDFEQAMAEIRSAQDERARRGVHRDADAAEEPRQRR